MRVVKTTPDLSFWVQGSPSNASAELNSPLGPCAPGGPCGPVAPGAPRNPLKPRGPRSPRFPLGPRGPLADCALFASTVARFEVAPVPSGVVTSATASPARLARATDLPTP